MKKIPTIFKRNPDNLSRLLNEPHPDCMWVFDGEGAATRKYDGTACMFDNDVLYKRYDVKKGRTKPDDFIPSQEPDEITGNWPGWVPVGDGPSDKWFREAWRNTRIFLQDGTYELCGPKINGNPEEFDDHVFVRHGCVKLNNVPTSFDKLEQWFIGKDIEGVVWHHSDGRMAKIKKKDFGQRRKDEDK